MPRLLEVDVKPDHLARLISARTPLAALTELVWNSFDADARKVSIVVERSILGTIDKITVSDDGHGMPYAETAEAFASLGGSRKKDRTKTRDGRMLHGRLGKGRFKAFALGTNVAWTTVVRENGKAVAYGISAAKENLKEFRLTDPKKSRNPSTGTSVAVTGVAGAPPTLEASAAVEELTSAFALYLRTYPDVRLEYDGRTINPTPAIAREEEISLPSRIPGDTERLPPAKLTVIEWNIDVERALFLCDAEGVTLARRPLGIHAPGYSYTAYLKAAKIRQAEENGTLDLEELDSTLESLTTAAKQAVKAYFRRREAERAQGVVAEWKKQDLYPYRTDPKDAVEKIERQVFDVVALNINAYLPAFSEADAQNKRLTLSLVRQALESDASSLQKILQDVLGLPPEKQEELARLLRRTSLSAIISAARTVAERVDFLRGLELLVFPEADTEVIRERTQLHRLVAENTWMFGEEFNLSVDDQSLTEVLRQHCEDLEIEILDDAPVVREDGSEGVIDLMLSRAIPQTRKDKREHLVVELKRPTVKIGAKELAQVESYALAVARDKRFQRTDVEWHFWCLSDDLTDLVASKSRQPNQPEGLITQLEDGRVKIWVRTWSEILQNARGRLAFFQERLELQADRTNALGYLRETYAKYLPDPLAVSPKGKPEKSRAGERLSVRAKSRRNSQ
jgi:hypothetical protein